MRVRYTVRVTTCSLTTGTSTRSVLTITRGATGTAQRHAANVTTMAIKTARGTGMRIEKLHMLRHQGLGAFGKIEERNRAGACGAFHSGKRRSNSWSDSSSSLSGSMRIPCLSIWDKHRPQPLPGPVQARFDGPDVGSDDPRDLFERSAFILEHDERFLLEQRQRGDS